jgi:hypothetical protein
MLKMYASGVKDGKPVKLVILGLSFKNLEKLKEGRPIKIMGDTIGLTSDVEFLIFSGETEQSMHKEMQQFVGPDTEVYIDPRLK